MVSVGSTDEILLPAAVDTLPINLAILDADGTILVTNTAWREFGRENDLSVRPDTLGVNYLDVTEQADGESAQAVVQGLRAILDGDRDEVEVEYPCHTPDRKRWFLMRAAPFEVDGRRYVTVAHVDVTARVEGRRDSERFERAVEAAGHAIFITDADGTITYVNPAFEEITGYTSEEALGRTPAILQSGEMDETYYADLWETILAGDVWDEIVVNRRKSGELYYANQTIAPVVDDGGVVEFVAVQTDVTEFHETTAHLDKLDTLLRHDVRNDLNVIQANAELLQAESPESDYAKNISDAVDALLGTVEKGRRVRQFLEQTGSPTPQDIGAIVEAVVATHRERESEATVTAEIPETASALAVSELDTAIAELLDNAVVHSDRDRPRIEVTVDVSGEWVDIHVADDGPGIPEMEYDSFEPGTMDPLHHDTGFGLNYAYWVARRSGGQLVVGENEPRGAVVTVRLPRATVATD